MREHKDLSESDIRRRIAGLEVEDSKDTRIRLSVEREQLAALVVARNAGESDPVTATGLHYVRVRQELAERMLANTKEKQGFRVELILREHERSGEPL